MSEPIIKVENLSKKYQIGSRESYYSLRDKISGIFDFKNIVKKEKEEFWALKDVNFEVKAGESVGIIGRNGAGKSTLLKILSRITPPTTGKITMNGRVASLLEVGTGFNPELTGRDNIFLNGAILGMTRDEIKKKFDEIVTFAEIEHFLDTPVKRYSSGMYMRLAFAVAAHLESEILIVDEVLAVGDAQFQKKCLGKMNDVTINEGRTVLFVSHNMGAVSNLCQKGILINKGEIVSQGKVEEVVKIYQENITSVEIVSDTLKLYENRSGNGHIRIVDFWIEDSSGGLINQVVSGQEVTWVFSYKCLVPEKLKNVDVGFSIHNKDDYAISVIYSSYFGKYYSNLRGKGLFKFRVKELPFSKGKYRIGVRVLVNGVEADWPKSGAGVMVVGDSNFYERMDKVPEDGAPVLLSGSWS